MTNNMIGYGEQEDESAKRSRIEAARISTLTDSEREVITLVCFGLKDRQVAQQIGISEAALRQVLNTIFTKLGVSNRLDLIIYAYAYGLASIPS